MPIMADRDGRDRPRDTALGTPVVSAQRLRVVDLLGERREAILEHNGADYRLRITSNGKLILTK